MLPPDVLTVAVEAGSPQGWCEFPHSTFGVSAPGPVAYARLGITAVAVAQRVQGLLSTAR